ncbi:unnamed protein product [Adineta steineri]|uniref:Macoilin n=2 Tax=Adineta steineri TaxID=433720 RepID=A0A815Q277_9BILA|nr:unnamed protein product [Adineta steineri]CAF3889832.1 unnamed protein product [Adineta steineri]
MKRRTNFDSIKIRKSIRRSRLTEGIYGSALMYLKFIFIWGIIMAADYLLEFRFEYLWPFWLVLRSIYDSFKYQGLLFSLFFVLIAFIADLICYILLPVQWLFFAASSYVWIQYVWQTERGICLGTVVLWVLFVWLEASVRLREIKTIDLCRPFAAHCIGYPMVTLGFGFKTYLAYKWRLRKQRDVRKINESYIQLINQALPIEVQQEAEKERLSREKGTFTESYDECTNQSNIDGNYSPSSPSSSINNSNLLSSVLINSQTQLNNHSTSLPCTVSKRPQKLNNNDDLSSTNSLVQTTATTATTTTRNNKISNGNNNDEESLSTYKQQKKQLVKSSNTQNTQSRRQQKKQETREQIRATSRDSSSSYNNGFGTTTSIENSDIEKNLQISKLEGDIQRLNQSIEKQKNSELQLRTQLTDLKSVRKDLDDLRAENTTLQSKYESVNTQRNRDKQRVIELEKTINEEKQNRQRLESQIKTEKTLTKKLQDDLTKLSLIPPRSECTEQCMKRRRDQENETREMRKLLNDKDERIKLLDNEIKTLLKYRESQADTEVLYQHYSQLKERNAHLQDSLSAETRIKLDLFSALGEVKRQLEIANGAIREKERELIAALHSQHQVNTCLFNGHRQSSGHSSPTNQLIDTNNNPTTSPSSVFYSPPTTITPPPLQNATSNLDPNAQDFCLSTLSTNNI